MPPSPHSTFTEIKIHTAKCDICNKHNALTMYRCVDCGQQCCTPCLIGKGGDGIHVLNAESTIIPAVKFVPTNKMKKKAQEPEQQAEQSDFIMADEDGKNDAWDEVAASERLKSDTKNNSALVEQFVPARSNTADKGVASSPTSNHLISIPLTYLISDLSKRSPLPVYYFIMLDLQLLLPLLTLPLLTF